MRRTGRDGSRMSGAICLMTIPLLKLFFVLSAGTEAGLSFGHDSRYFGPVSGETILGVVHYLGNPGENSSAENSGKVRK